VLINIGAKAGAEDLVSLLLECHHRIRGFSALGVELGTRSDLPAADVVQGCERVERYFGEALPLHVADEEESLLPRLRGLRPEVDVALAAMHAQHQDHKPHLAALLAALRALRGAPGDASLRAALLAIIAPLKADFEAHLVAEEEIICPAIKASMPAEVQAEVVGELRARRKGGPALR
jgi:iron-sulfur cluster repair protein YtfE (RIC family)